MEDFKYPICPINIYYEGDEDECDESKCDFDIEIRRCSQGCTDVKIQTKSCKMA